ncbi:potassium channel family protein [Methanobacterium sp. 42_16]|uniref:potassium channel family protein n=1 Tax=Methanobacterium sp. 42_16 TaxID=1641383 RepID=UPI0007463D34|nr:ion channel [Methanobacterium sp. 42_16]KUK75237.1 MAG: Uncharacterized protein XD90_0497 [Methanobacterium sp. 42_16]
MNGKLKYRLELVLEIILMVFIFLDNFLLFISVFLPLRPDTYSNIAYLDLVTCALLIFGYWVQHRRTGPQESYLKKNWNGILAVIPFYFLGLILLGIDEASPILKILALIKVVTLLMAARQVGKAVDRFVTKSRLVYGFAFFVVVLVFCSVMFFLIEHGVNPEVTTFEDSVWYVVQTITTVGYGDVVPITSWGRVVGIIAMVSAIGISSLLTAATTSSLMDKLREDREKIVQKSVEYVAKIDDTVNDLESQMAKEDDVKGIKTEINEIKSEITEIKNMLREIKE